MKTPEVHEDLRVRRTRKLLWDALMAELSEREFEEITVQHICERAMVHRTTFYKHYPDKYALLEQGMRHMYATLIAQVNAPPTAFSVDDPPPYFVQMFQHVAEHQQFYKLMLCGEGVGRFQKLFKDYLAEEAEAKMRAFTVSKHPSVPPALHAHFLAGAVISTLAWWLAQGMPYPPQQMAQYLQVLQKPARPPEFGE